jgi:antitoxin (DNA-binding transcriptional repressor) of toxin-antitoxin stability system
MITVSIQEMRFDFAKVKSALQRGEELMLTYRNRPLAKLLPVAQKESTEPDPALSFGIPSEDIPVMTNQAIDSAIYG